MNKTKIFLLSAFLCVGTLLGTSCNNDNDDFVIWSNNTEQSNPTNSQNQQSETDTETVSVSGVTLDKSSISIELDETLQLTATVSPDNATDKTVTWSSSDDAVATVENGKVTAIKEGEATITAKVGDKTAECKVTVSAPAAKTITVSVDSDDATIKPSFTEDNVTAKLKMSISEGETELGTLTLQDADGNFSGELTTAPSADGVTLTASITTTGDASSSTVSIADLIKNCAHNYTGTFAYKTDSKVMLTDDKAYIEIIMSPLQHNIDVTIGGDKQPYAMSNDGKVWIAVDGGTKFTTNFTDEETATAGKITTIDRSGFVDLGIEGGILWADKNIGATNVYDYGNYYAWGETTTKETQYNWSTYKYGNAYDQLTKYCNDSYYGKDGFTDELTVLESDDDVAYTQNTNWSMPTTEEFATLKSSCYWVWMNDYSGKKGYIVYKNQGSEAGAVVGSSGTAVDGYSTADDTHIFLPAAGYRGDSNLSGAGFDGYYWSSSLYTDNPSHAFGLFFNDGYVEAQGDGSRYYGQSVRAVRRK